MQAQREAEKRGAGEGGGEGVVNTEREGPSLEFGLKFAQREQALDEDGGDVAMVDATSATEAAETETKKPLTEDEIALQSLVRESNGDGEGRRSDLVIGATPQDNEGHGQDEMTSFRADVASRPDPAGMDEYAAVPVEEFGAALLRGMGWREGQPVGRGKYGAADNGKTNGAKARIPERRPGYLGIGAKDVPGKNGGGAEAELGAWGKSAMRKANRDNGASGEGLYTPVLMKQKKTGELITEAEFKVLAKEGGGGGEGKNEKKEDDWRERRDRNLEKSERDKRRDYDDDDNDDYDRGRRASSRRDRSRSSGDKDQENRRRKRHDDDEGRDGGRDDRYYRDREKYRDRDSDRKHRDSRRHRERDGKDDYDSRASSSRSSRRDRGDRDSGRESHRERARYVPKDRRNASREGEVW